MSDGQIAWYCRELGPHVRLLLDDSVAFSRSLVGASIVVPRPAQRCAWLELLAVAPGQQGRGIGQQLLDLAEAATSSAGFPHLDLAVATHNEGAIRFYERRGYHRVGDEPTDALDRGSRWRYSKALTAATFAPSAALGLQAPDPPSSARALVNRILFRALGVRGQGLP